MSKHISLPEGVLRHIGWAIAELIPRSGNAIGASLRKPNAAPGIGNLDISSVITGARRRKTRALSLWDPLGQATYLGLRHDTVRRDETPGHVHLYAPSAVGVSEGSYGAPVAERGNQRPTAKAAGEKKCARGVSGFRSTALIAVLMFFDGKVGEIPPPERTRSETQGQIA